MAMMTDIFTEEQVAKRDAFVNRMLESARGVFDIYTIYIGHQLGFYNALASGIALTSAELAARTGTHKRYVREWLEQQTITGVLEILDASAPEPARRFRLPAGHMEVLTLKDSLSYLAPLSQILVGAVSPVHAVLKAFRTGGGVPFSDYGVDMREGQGGMNRATFLQELGQVWLPSIPDIHECLQSPARIADIGCGVGWSSIGMALAYPTVQVDGYDLDTPSIATAIQNAAEFNVAERVQFFARDGKDAVGVGTYDLVTAFECIHDMSNPVSVLHTMHDLAGETGSVIVVDERVSDTFTETGNDIEWLMYGFSVLHCLPAGMADGPSAATGTVMRTDTLRHYAREAGFRDVEVLPIENFFFRVYRLIR